MTDRISVRLISACLASALLVSGTGCGTTTDEHGGLGPAPTIAISLSTNVLTIPQGGSQDLNATITRTGFTGAIVIETEGAPAGVTAAASGISTSGSITTGTVTVSVAASVAPGSYNLTVRASGSGVTSVTQGVTLIVPVPPTPVITLALSTGSQGVDQGASGAPITVSLTRASAPDPITLTLEGAPPGLIGIFNPAPVTGTSATLTLTAGGAVPEGVYNLTVRASTPGAADVTAPLQVLLSIPASYTISVPSVTLSQQSQTDLIVTLTRINHAAPVTLSLENAPAGVTGSFNPAAPVGSKTSTLTLTVGAATPPGPHTVTVRGKTSDLPDRTTTFVLTVNQLAQGTYTLSTAPVGTVSVSRGGGGMALLVELLRSIDFTQPVSLSITGAPPGMALTYPQSGIMAPRVPLSISASPGTGLGPYQLTLTATTPNLPDRVASLTVVVNAGNLALDYSACPGNLPEFLAVQDGKTGPWIRLLPQGGVFLTRLNSAAGGFSTVVPGPGGEVLGVQLAATAELQGLTGAQLCGVAPAPSGKTVNVLVSGLAPAEQGLVSLGGVTRTAAAGSLNPSLVGVLSGAQDLVAISMPIAGGFSANKYILRASINPADGSTLLPALDLTSGEALDPVTATATISGMVGGETLGSVGTSFLSGASCTVAPLWSVTPGPGSTSPMYGLQPAASGVHRVSVTASGNGRFRSVDEHFASFGDQTIALGSEMPVPVLTQLSGNYLRLQVQATLPSDLIGPVTVAYGNATINASAAWLGGALATLGMPDFIVTAGWNDSFGPVLSGQPVDWVFGTSGQPLANPCAGGRSVSASVSGVFTP